MLALAVYMEEPAIGIFKDVYVFMGYLPQQMIEIIYCAWRAYFLINGITTNRFLALSTLFVQRNTFRISLLAIHLDRNTLEHECLLRI